MHLWTLCLFALSVSGQEVRESGEDEVVTPLSPVPATTSPAAPPPPPPSPAPRPDAATWSLQAALVDPQITTSPSPPSVTTTLQQLTDGFRPSTHLGDYIEDEPRAIQFQAPKKYIPPKFKSFTEDFIMKPYKGPYRTDTAWGGTGGGWRPSAAQQPEADAGPVAPDAPSTDLTYNYKKHAMHRALSWHRTAQALAALLPAGLLFAALSPALITVSPSASEEAIRSRHLL